MGSALTDLRQDLDGLDIDVGAASGMFETYSVSVGSQVRTGPGGLPLQGGTGGNDGVQIDIININIERAEVGVFAEGQGELRACEGDLSRISLSAGKVHGVVEGTGTRIDCPAAVVGPGEIGIIVSART